MWMQVRFPALSSSFFCLGYAAAILWDTNICFSFIIINFFLSAHTEAALAGGIQWGWASTRVPLWFLDFKLPVIQSFVSRFWSWSWGRLQRNKLHFPTNASTLCFSSGQVWKNSWMITENWNVGVGGWLQLIKVNVQVDQSDFAVALSRPTQFQKTAPECKIANTLKISAFTLFNVINQFREQVEGQITAALVLSQASVQHVLSCAVRILPGTNADLWECCIHLKMFSVCSGCVGFPRAANPIWEPWPCSPCSLLWICPLQPQRRGYSSN